MISAARAILSIESITAVKNIKSYAIGSGYDSPKESSGDLRLSMNTPEIEGPIDIPIKNNSIVIPKAVPLKWTEAETKETLKDPISDSASPMAITANAIEITNCEGWYKKSTMDPVTETIVPKTVGFKLPILLTKNPDKTEIINDSIIKGNWTAAVSTGPPPKPKGGGLWINTGKVW